VFKTRECGTTMCEKCIEIDAKIDRYQTMSRLITDQPTLDAIKKLTDELNAEKVALHPEQQQ
jgi:hypothetical protein